MTIEALNIDICVCTFQRSHVTKTLHSISQLNVRPNWVLRIIVSDNDDRPSARRIVEAAAHECSLSLTYVHAPARNISVARNACLDAATAPLVAFIDDDEVAAPDWLMALVNCIEETGADVVLGPVQAVYGTDCPAWMRNGDFHSTKPVWVTGEIRTGYTCNVLFRRASPALDGRRFRPELGGTGGEDTVFFSGVYRAGGKITYAPEASVMEPVAESRATMSWLLHRRFRFGETHALVLAADASIRKRITHFGLAVAKICACFVALCVNATQWRYWLLRGTLHVGLVFGLLRRSHQNMY